MNDYQFTVGSMALEIEAGFVTDVTGSRVLPYTNLMINAITYELSLTRIEFYRNVYSALDYLRDLGGLFSALGPICAGIVAMIQYRG